MSLPSEEPWEPEKTLKFLLIESEEAHFRDRRLPLALRLLLEVLSNPEASAARRNLAADLTRRHYDPLGQHPQIQRRLYADIHRFLEEDPRFIGWMHAELLDLACALGARRLPRLTGPAARLLRLDLTVEDLGDYAAGKALYYTRFGRAWLDSSRKLEQAVAIERRRRSTRCLDRLGGETIPPIDQNWTYTKTGLHIMVSLGYSGATSSSADLWPGRSNNARFG